VERFISLRHRAEYTRACAELLARGALLPEPALRRVGRWARVVEVPVVPALPSDMALSTPAPVVASSVAASSVAAAPSSAGPPQGARTRAPPSSAGLAGSGAGVEDESPGTVETVGGPASGAAAAAAAGSAAACAGETLPSGAAEGPEPAVFAERRPSAAQRALEFSGTPEGAAADGPAAEEKAGEKSSRPRGRRHQRKGRAGAGAVTDVANKDTTPVGEVTGEAAPGEAGGLVTPAPPATEPDAQPRDGAAEGESAAHSAGLRAAAAAADAAEQSAPAPETVGGGLRSEEAEDGRDRCAPRLLPSNTVPPWSNSVRPGRTWSNLVKPVLACAARACASSTCVARRWATTRCSARASARCSGSTFPASPVSRPAT